MNDELNAVTPEPEAEVQPAGAAGAAPEVKIGDWLKAGWEIFSKDMLKCILGALIAFVIGGITCGILMGPMYVGLYKCFLKKARGQDFEYGELFDGVRTQFLPSFILFLVLLVATLAVNAVLGWIPCVGLVFCIAWGLIVGTIGVYAFVKIAEAPEPVEVGKIFTMLKENWETLKPAFLMFLLWYLVVKMVAGIGVAACGIGVLFTAPIAIMALVVSYMDVFLGEQPVQSATEPPAVEVEGTQE